MVNYIEQQEPAAFLVSPPSHVGGYRIGNYKTNYIQFNLIKKPNWLNRQCMRIFLGWYWFDDLSNS
ncbi:hypothetical protein CCP3SC1AL1_2760006 [Gammaproteobacteria bacterium]